MSAAASSSPVNRSATGMLLTASPGPSARKRLRNQMRCWAAESGIRSGRGRAVSAGRAPLPHSGATRAARPSTVGASNSARTGTWASSAAPSRATTRVAVRLLPPRAKKSSSRPTRSAPSRSANTAATCRCTAVTGAR
ncbi:Uncharacterised protein [Mycobacteroides abscessus subsp. abscessus]|nr:Uncharacterised protein [Mycobacteroides abscessus subsp. abscessus]